VLTPGVSENIVNRSPSEIEIFVIAVEDEFIDIPIIIIKDDTNVVFPEFLHRGSAIRRIGNVEDVIDDPDPRTSTVIPPIPLIT